MPAIDVSGLTYRYGAFTALRNVTFGVPEGALYALLGPNGSGKTTLLQVLTGLRKPNAGRVTIAGVDSAALTWRDRMSIGYIAEGQPLPRWMRLHELERYLAPLYPTWDHSLADALRARFDLDPARVIRTLSRGEHMKAALLCALAPRPKVLLMDEPFTGMDALVKDELVRGLLESAGQEGWTVLLCSHDIGELELLADWVGFLDAGGIRLSEPMDALRQQFKYVDLFLDDAVRSNAQSARSELPPNWLAMDRAGQHVSFVLSHGGAGSVEGTVAEQVPDARHISVRDATLREVFVALARRSPKRGSTRDNGGPAA